MQNSNTKPNTLNSKRFVLRQSLVGKNTIINVTFKSGKTVKYNHDKAFKLMSKVGLQELNCFKKYKSYTATNNIPKVLRDTELV